jgi:hypothetical protein
LVDVNKTGDEFDGLTNSVGDNNDVDLSWK